MKAAPPLFLPGLMCDQSVWGAQVQGLADYDPVAVPGYGLARTLEEMAARALELAPPRFSLAGHSMGARVALEVYRAAPGRVERIALLDTGIHPLQPGEPEKRQALLDIGREHGIERLVDEWLPPMVHPDRRGDAAIMQPMHAMSCADGMARVEAQIEALLARPDVLPLLAAIRMPTLVATGRQDEWSPVEQHVEIAGMIPGAELVIFENSGHMAPVEVPDQVNAALRRWLERPAAHSEAAPSLNTASG